MPTGYTADIEKGISFEKFIMSCARAFGALIMMRDDLSDAEIPTEFEPSTYHRDRIKETERELAEVKKMTLPEADKKAVQEYTKELAAIEKGIQDANNLREKCMAMLGKAKAWQPPSPDHTGLKDFMIEQLKSLIDYDCSTKYYEENADKLYVLSASEWITKRTTRLLKDLTYHTKEDNEERTRIAGRNLWLKQLRESLK